MSRAAAMLGLLGMLGLASAAEELPLHDPMRPYVEAAGGGAAAAPPRYVLTTVLISTQRRVAVINGMRYREGDEVDGARIVRIEHGLVRLRRANEDLVVRLSDGRADSRTNEGDSAQ